MISLQHGDCRDILKKIDDRSFQTCVTSPPYFGLRNYGNNNQLGIEKTPEEYVSNLVEVFREVKRTLKDDGTLWLNLGDSYAGSGKGLNGNGSFAGGGKELSNRGTDTGRSYEPKPQGFKRKDLYGIPWRVAFALQSDGWYLRQDIIWHKPNSMPESVRDRCTKSHEYIFLLSKSSRYYFDNEAIKEPTTTRDSLVRDRDSGKINNTPGRSKSSGLKTNDYKMKNKRDVWTVNTDTTSHIHFATFPAKLIEPCILAGSPAGGLVLDPFMGSGTTGVVADQHHRDFFGIDINNEYVELARDRIENSQPNLIL